MCAGEEKLQFPRVKINKMEPIKKNLSRSFNGSFQIRFIIGTAERFSEPFQLVSHVKYVPIEDRWEVRPQGNSKYSEGIIDLTGIKFQDVDPVPINQITASPATSTTCTMSTTSTVITTTLSGE